MIISQHGGKVAADSSPGEWTEIKFSLPLRKKEKEVLGYEEK
jgi:signal transduction histidine kinase